jgi:large subunit ribosomal protein L2
VGKKLRSQRRGKGSFSFIGTKNALADVKYIPVDERQKASKLRGEIVGLFPDCSRSAVLAEVLFEDKRKDYIVAPEGLKEGQTIEFGKDAGLSIGNVLPLAQISEGCPICNIEKRPGDGGSLVKASGLYGVILGKEKNLAFVRLPSGKSIELGLDCRATIGCVACGGRGERPMLKAGTRFHLMRARRRHYPHVRGVAMNPVSHPFGGGQHHPGKSKSTARNRPPGRKVGAIASSRTGRRKKN